MDAVPDRRTRSQLTLPDDILRIHSRSPLKDARIALKSHIPTRDTDDDDEDDDELLLSPTKPHTKRSASPPLEDGSPLSPLDTRQRKRTKRDLTADVDALRPSHSRNHSEPILISASKSPRKRSATTTLRTQHASKSPTPTRFSPAPLQAKGRAHSVPLFSSNPIIPHIDFRNPPPSPRRARSRSPSKDGDQPKLRITPALPSIPDEQLEGEEGAVHPTPPIAQETVDNAALSAVEEVVPESPEVPSRTVKSVNFAPEVPSTPEAPNINYLASLSFLSPLTPLPETPHPSKLAATDRYTGTPGWGLRQDLDLDDMEESAPPAKLPALQLSKPQPQPQIHRSQPSATPSLQRPALEASSSSFGPKKPQNTTTTTRTTAKSRMAPPPPRAPAKAGAGSSRILISGSKPGTSNKNAFALMMPKSSSHAVKPNTIEKYMGPSNRSTGMGPSRTAATAIMKGKGKKKEDEVSSANTKMKLKAKMRPREKVKPAQNFINPLIVDDSETEADPGEDAQDDSVDHELQALLEIAKKLEQPEKEVPKSAEKEELEKRPVTPLQTTADLSMQDIMNESPIRVVERRQEPESELEMDVLADTTNVPKSPRTGEPEEEIGNSTPQDEIADTQPANAPETKELEAATVTSSFVSASHQDEVPDTRPTNAPETKEPEPATVTGGSVSVEGAAAKVRITKLPLGKKRVPTAAIVAPRVTRSSSKQKDNDTKVESMPVTTITEPLPAQMLSRNTSTPKSTMTSLLPANSAKHTASGSIKKKIQADPEEHSSSSLTDVSTHPPTEPEYPPGSPMKVCSPTKQHSFAKPTAASAARASVSPIKPRMPMKPASSPSPVKLARAASMYARPTGLLRASSVDLGRSGVSSLSTLSNALEKLRMPPPARPNTSMGFNEANSEADARSKDDVNVFEIPTVERSTIKRSVTIGSTEFATAGSSLKTPITAATSVTSNDRSSSNQASGSGSSSKSKPLVQRSLASFLAGGKSPSGSIGNQRLQAGTGAIMRAGGRPITSGKPRMFGLGSTGGAFGHRLTQKVSRNPGLPSVMASPMKGGGDDTAHDDMMAETSTSMKRSDLDDISMEISETSLKADSTTESADAGKGKEKEKLSGGSWKRDASRRASLASHALSQSLSSLPLPQASNGRGMMGPPATPPRAGTKSSNSSYPSSASLTGSPPKPANGATRASARIAKSAPSALGKIRGVSSGKDAASSSSTNPVPETLKILKDCVIFVDVRTDDGDEAGSLFVEMLESIGAKILTRVGQTCTHIVYKNGLMSTLNRYRLLRDPKPLAVGIAWVVECVEQRTRVDENKFLINLDEENVAGINKRRRSMLPKLIPREAFTTPSDTERDEGTDGDISMDGSTSSLTMDDDLPPLEKARRRRNLLMGHRT